MAFDADSLLQAVLRGTLILSLAVVTVMALLKLLRLRSAKIRWRAWFGVLLCGCGIAPLTLRLPWLGEPPTVETTANVPESAPPARDETLEEPRDVEILELDLPETSAEGEDFRTEVAATPLEELSPQAPVRPSTFSERPDADKAHVAAESFSWKTAFVGVWLAGIGVIFLRGVWRYGYFLKIVRACQTAPPDWAAAWREVLAAHQVRATIPLLVSENYGPALCRLPRGYALVVPGAMWESAPEEVREIILRHELAHYQRRDLVWSLIARWLAAPHWFNPLAHLAIRKLDESAEWACDDAATGGRAERQLVLSKTLLSLSETANPPGAMQAAAAGNALAVRIRRLLEPTQEKEGAMRTAMLMGAMVCLCAFAWVRVELVARAQEAKSPQGDPPVEVETDLKDDETEAASEVPTIEVDPVTQALFEQYVLSGGKINTSDVEAAIELVASRGRSGDFWRVVLREFDKAHQNKNVVAPRKNLLAVLTKMLAVDGAARWQAERQWRNAGQAGNVDLPQVSLSPVLGPEVLEHIIDEARREQHLFNLTDYVVAVRQAHDPRGMQFLYDVLDGGSSRAEFWKQPQGGTWTEPQFVAAVALAELGDGAGVEWLIHYSDKLGTTLFRVPHAKTDELYLACNYALVELTGYQPPLNNGEWQQSGWKEWWGRNREHFVPAASVPLRVK